jgi:hypothetical protein
VREIATTAGVAFPAAAFVIPAAPEKGIHQKTHAYNPSLLYKELLKKKRWGDKKVTRESSTYGYDDTPEPERKPNPYEHSRWYALEPITIYDGNLVLGQVAKGSPLTGTGTCGPLNGDDYANVEDVEVDTHGEFSGETWVKLPDLLAKTEGGSEVYRKLFFPEEFPMEMLTESDPGTTETGGDGGRDLLMEDDGNREGFTMVDEPEPV